MRITSSSLFDLEHWQYRGFLGFRVSFFGIGFGGVAMSRLATMLSLRRAMASVAKHVDAAAEVVQKKPGTGHPKKNNLFDVARLLPGWGIGHKVAKTHWQPQTYYKIYDVKLGKDAGHGTAWGIYHEQDVEAGKLQKISGANKRCWKYVADGPERNWEYVASQNAPKEATMEILAQ